MNDTFKVRVVEVCKLDKSHPNRPLKRNHILVGYVRTLCGLKEFNGDGQEMVLAEIPNLCGACKRLVR